MKTLILILVLFSSSLFAENNLPAPFGIQLGEKVDENIICKKENVSFAEYYRLYNSQCLEIIPPIKNERYKDYNVRVFDNNLIVIGVSAYRTFYNVNNAMLNIKDYNSNLKNFLIEKYNLHQTMNFRAARCAEYTVDIKFYKENWKEKSINFCDKAKKESNLTKDSRALKRDPSTTARIMKLNKDAIENLEKLIALMRYREVNFQDRIWNEEECKEATKISWERSYASETLQDWFSECSNYITLENALMKIDITGIQSQTENADSYISINYNIKSSSNYDRLSVLKNIRYEEIKKMHKIFIEEQERKSKIDQNTL